MDNTIHFSSAFVFDKEVHKDICSIIYTRSTIMSVQMAVCIAVFGWLCPLTVIDFSWSVFVYVCSFWFYAVLLYWLHGAMVRKGYKQRTLLYGTEPWTKTVSFSDVITVQIENNTPLQYQYSQILGLKATRGYYLLYLGHSVHIAVPKTVTAHGENKEFIPFLMERCTNLKKRKVRDLSRAKSTAVKWLVADGVLFAVSLLLYIARS